MKYVLYTWLKFGHVYFFLKIMSFFGIFWKAEIYINSENKKKKETGVIKMIRTKLSRTLKESPFELYSLQINREISTKIFSYIPFEPKKIYDPACRYGNMLQYFNQMYCDIVCRQSISLYIIPQTMRVQIMRFLI